MERAGPEGIMAEMAPTTSVTILGEEYRFRGASPELVAELAGLVDRKFREFQGARPAMDLKRLAVMVCMNMAEELTRERDAREDSIRSALERSRQCRALLERTLGESNPGTFAPDDPA